MANSNEEQKKETTSMKQNQIKEPKTQKNKNPAQHKNKSSSQCPICMHCYNSYCHRHMECSK